MLNRVLGSGLLNPSDLAAALGDVPPAHRFSMSETTGAYADTGSVGGVTLTPGSGNTRVAVTYLPGISNDKAVQSVGASGNVANFSAGILPASADFTALFALRILAQGNPVETVFWQGDSTGVNEIFLFRNNNDHDFRLITRVASSVVLSTSGGADTGAAPQTVAVFITRSGSAFKTYIGGEHGTADTSGTDANALNTTNGRLLNRASSFAQGIDGNVSEVMTWNSVLTEAQMDAVYAGLGLT